MEQGEWLWVAKYAQELLRACPRQASTEQQRRNRASLHALLFVSKVEQGLVQQLDAPQQRQLFNAWPHSVHVWSLHSRYALVCMNARKSV